MQLTGHITPESLMTLEAYTKWRKVHIPIFIVFAVLALGHIISIFLFWGWA